MKKEFVDDSLLKFICKHCETDISEGDECSMCEEFESKISCKICGDTGTRIKGFFNDNNEIQVTKSELCICQQD